MPLWSRQGMNRRSKHGYAVLLSTLCLILVSFQLIAYQVSTTPETTTSSPTTTTAAGIIATASRFALPPTFSLYNGEVYASVPCIAPYCEFKCQRRPENVSCEPPPREPIRVRTCKKEINNQILLQQIFPLPFAGFEEDVVACVPKKVHDFATIVPGNKSTYVFGGDHEDEYHRDYRNSRYSMTWRKYGWDCMRHYEVLSAGSVPWFPDLENSPEGTMNFLPKKLIVAARDIQGVTRGKIDHEVFDERAYYEKSCQLLEYTRRYLTVTAMASYVLETMGYPNVEATPSKPKVLLIQNEWMRPDYEADLLTIGMRKLLGNGAIDVPYRHFLYEYADDTPPNGLKKNAIYGRGFTYSHRMRNDPTIDRSNIEARIKAKEFDLIIYSCWHRPMPYLNVTLSVYSPEKVAMINGDDWHGWSVVEKKHREFWGKAFFFMRELPDGCPFE